MICPICKQPISMSQPVQRIETNQMIDFPEKLSFLKLIVDTIPGEPMIVHKACLDKEE